MAKNEGKIKQLLQQDLSEALDLPQEILSDLPRIVLVGNKEIHIENFMSLIEYSIQRVRIATRSGVLVIDGSHLEAQKMTADNLVIRGEILQVSFLQ